MSKRNNILLVILIAAILFFSAFILQAKAAGELWQVLGNKLAPVVNSFGLRIPSLGSSGSPCLVVSANGTVSTSTCGAGGGGSSDKWATSTDNVSITPNVGQGLIVGSASSTFNGLNVNNSTTTNATSTTLYVAGQATLGSLSGFLKATAGKVGVALVNLASDITGTLDISANTNLAVSSPITLTGDTVGCQTASAGQNGCLASGDFTTFAGKESVLSFVYPLVRSVNSISTAFGTTTANIFSLLNQFQGNASTTRLSVYRNAYFGATATSTFDSTGALTLATPLAVGSGGTGATSLNNLITLGTHTTGNYVATLADSGASTLTISGSGSETAAVTAGINLANPNTWTGLQQFNRASSTQESAYRAYFGATATSTFDTAGVLTLASPLAVGSGGTGASSLTNLITLGTHTVGNYLATLTSSGSVTVGGSGSETAAGTVDLNMANANIWTALQSFNNASTTGISALSTLYVGRTATSTIIGDNNGTSTLASGLLVGNRGLTVSSLTNCDTVDTDNNGFFKCGTDATGGGGASTEKWATSTDSVSITPNVGQGIIINAASSTINAVSITNGTTTNATSTNLKVSGQLSIASLSGFLKATAGVVATAVIDLVNDVGTSILPVTNGGTGWANIQAGAIPYGNGTSRLATTSAGTAGNVLALLSGVPTWTATTTAGTGLTYSAGAFNVNTSQNIATLSNLTGNGAILTSGGVGTLGTYAGTSCTNQFVRSLNGSIVATCATVGAADVSLANLTATDSTLTFSGTYTGATARTIGLNLGNANTWTALQQFSRASSTIESAYRAYFGGSATTTIGLDGSVTMPSGSTFTKTGVTDGCATWATGALNSTGSPCGSGGGAGAQSSTTATYVIYTNSASTNYWAFNATTSAVTTNSNFSTLLQAVVNTMDDGALGGSIYLTQGTYYSSATTTINGNDAGGGNDSGSIEIWGAGQDATKIVLNGNSDFLDFDKSAMPRVHDLSVYIKGGSNAFVSDSNSDNARAVWNFSFENVEIVATTTTTGYGFYLGNAFRGQFNNIEMFGLHNCARFHAEGTFNPGDFTWSRSFCELDSAANARAYQFTRAGTGFMNQMHFDVIEGIASGSGANFITGDNLEYSQFTGLNAEQFDILVDLDGTSGGVASDNYFQFNYVTPRNAIANLRGCRFATDAEGNTCEFAFFNTTASTAVVDDMNTNTDNPNTIIGYIGSDSGTASASTSAATVTLYRDISGYGTMDTNLKPNGNFGTWQFWGTLLSRGVTAAVDFANAVFLTIPTGTAEVLSHAGDISFDTTDNQFLIGTSTSPTPAVIPAVQRIFSRSVASTSVDMVSGGRIGFPYQRDGFTITEIDCWVEGGTSVVINLDTAAGGANTDSVTCDADAQSDTSMSANFTIAAGTLMALEFGTVTGAVDYTHVTVYGYWTRK